MRINFIIGRDDDIWIYADMGFQCLSLMSIESASGLLFFCLSVFQCSSCLLTKRKKIYLSLYSLVDRYLYM